MLTSASQMHFPSANVFSEFQSHAPNRLLPSPHGRLIGISKLTCPKLSFREAFPKHHFPPAADPGSLIGSFILLAAQTKNLGVTLGPSHTPCPIHEQPLLVPASVRVQNLTTSHRYSSGNRDCNPRLLSRV